MTLFPSRRRYIIGLFILLMISAITILNLSLQQEKTDAILAMDETGTAPPIPAEKGMFLKSGEAVDYALMPENKNNRRTLKAYYSRRAYPGGPPIIPHGILDEKGIGGNNCLQCHETGGFSPQFNAYAPITPHPELSNCLQCHVQATVSSLFKATGFTPYPPPKTGQSALAGSPPLIPHALHMRENCLSCHGSAAAPTEIRTTHPERTNCRQCHATPVVQVEWERPLNEK